MLISYLTIYEILTIKEWDDTITPKERKILDKINEWVEYAYILEYGK